MKNLIMMNNLNYTDFINNSNLPLLISGSLVFSVIGYLYMSGYIFNTTLSNNDLNSNIDSNDSDTIKGSNLNNQSIDSVYNTATQNTDVIIEDIEYIDKNIQTMNEIIYKDANIQTEDIKFNNNSIESVNNLGNQIYESSISYNDKLYNIALNLINKNDELNSKLNKDTIDQSVSPINNVIDLNHENFLIKLNQLINGNSSDNSLIDNDALRTIHKEYLNDIGIWVDNVNTRLVRNEFSDINVTTPITVNNSLLTPLQSCSNLSSTESLIESSPIIHNIINNNNNNIIQSVSTTIEQNSDQINNLMNLFTG